MLGGGLVLAVLASVAQARPTDGDTLFSFDPSDQIETLEDDGGLFRVHYSVEGPNITRLADSDSNGIPDFAEIALEVALTAHEAYAEAGFRAPLHESDVGAPAGGGSDAIDIYLVDFAGNADGAYSSEYCSGGVCAGYFTVENDFQGYGYSSSREGLETVVTHELFHAVQAAYLEDLDLWASEGSATWAVKLIDPSTTDFTWFARAYLEEPTRQLDRPPNGPVPSWAYGTGLFFDFSTIRHDATFMTDWLDDVSSGATPTDALQTQLELRDDSFEEAWPVFASWNLATGSRAGVAESYSYAARLDSVPAESEGSPIEDASRFYPLAASYFRLDHAGGELFLALDAAAPDLTIAVHPVADGLADGPVEDALVVLDGANPEPQSLGEVPAGGVWIVGSVPMQADSSVRRTLCVGSESDMAGCLPVDEEEEAAACGCASGGGGTGWLWVLAVVGLRRRR